MSVVYVRLLSSDQRRRSSAVIDVSSAVSGVCVSAADKMTVATKTKTYKLVVHKKGFGGSGESLPCTLSIARAH